MFSSGARSVRAVGAALGVALVLGLLGAAGPSHAQTGPSLRSIDRPVEVALDPTYQYYDTEAGRTLTQFSTHLTTSVPIGQRVTVEGRLGYARMDGDRLSQVQGLTDAVGRVTYAQPVGDGSLVFGTTVNAPVGTQNLSPEAFRTARFFSRNYYDARVSSFSRGFSVSPRVTWAVPVTDRFAVGIGLGYEHQRGFEPRADQGEYEPGDGVGGNAGFDYKLSQTSAVGADISVRRFGEDRLEGTRSFEAGSRISGTLRYLYRSGFTTVRAVARYANWNESTFGYRVGGPDRGQILPSHALALGSLQTRLTNSVDLHVQAAGHHYAETIQADEKLLGRLSVTPSVELADRLTLAPHATATVGSYVGLGGGLRVEGEF
jgi:hypothetical protein